MINRRTILSWFFAAPVALPIAQAIGEPVNAIEYPLVMKSKPATWFGPRTTGNLISSTQFEISAWDTASIQQWLSSGYWRLFAEAVKPNEDGGGAR
jgi:hypothetical protein